MRNNFLLLFSLIYGAASAQDFCSTTRKLIASAAVNFRNEVDPGKVRNGTSTLSWPSPIMYTQGEKPYITEGKDDKVRGFLQYVSRNGELEKFVSQMTECLAMDDPSNWKVSHSNDIGTGYVNEKKGVEISVRLEFNSFTKREQWPVLIGFVKSRPPMKWDKCNKHIPYLLMTGAPDFIFVDSASMQRITNNAFNFGGLLNYYPGEPGIYPIYGNYQTETGYVFFDKNGIMKGPSSGMARPFQEEFAWVSSDDLSSLYFFIDQNNKPVIPPTYHEAFEFEEGLAAVTKNDKWGYVDKTGKVTIPLIYEFAYPFQEGLGLVKKGSKWGFINKEGKEIITPKYDKLGNAYAITLGNRSAGNIFAVSYNKKWGLIDKTGKEIIPPKFSDPITVREDIGIFSINKLYGFIDQSGKQIVPPKYQELMPFNEGLAAFKKNGKWGYINKNGKEVIPAQYDLANFFIEGLASVKIKGKMGFIDKTGKVIIALVYESVDSWHEGLVSVSQNGKYGFIDLKGEVIIPFKYDRAGKFSSGMAVVQLNDSDAYFFIDRAGREYRQK